jgi:DNA-directed RNA polymerase I and III subunit RPAC1
VHQVDRFSAQPVRTAHEDILVAKLRPGQRVEIEMFAEKGIARTHAKWSAVATASYRLMPEIVVDRAAVRDERADELVAKCPMKVFDIEDLGGGHRTAHAARPRACTMCRECIREPSWEEQVKLRRVRDHFICA